MSCTVSLALLDLAQVGGQEMQLILVLESWVKKHNRDNEC